MRFQVLGQLVIFDDQGERCALRPQSERLAAFLLANPGRPMSAERIAEVLGSARLTGSGVRMALSRLRGVAGGRLETTSSGYRLVPEAGELDSAAFDGALVSPPDETPAARVERLRSALGLWHGDAYGEFAADDWARVEASRLELARLGALEDLAEAMTEVGAAGDAALLLHANLPALRYRERSAALLMEALAASGRIAEALRAYQSFRRTLIDDIGIEPSEALRAMESDLLLNDGATSGRWRSGTAPAPVAGNLIEPAISFVGRVRELHDVVTDLGESRLVSIVGPGGVGKTRVAVAAARSMASEFPDGLWFVDLSPLDNGDAVAHRTASTLGAPSGTETDLIELIVEHMRTRRALVVVDNCEHVLTDAARVVGALVDACPNLRVIVTSREALDVPAERVYPLVPLDLADSLELFRARAADAGRRVDFDTIDHDPIVEICRHVEGMPLAIELAARHVRSATPAEIVERLDGILRDTGTGTGAGQGRPDRHRTMRAVVEWSYRLLTESEQALFERLSVFAGDFDLEAATAVCEFAPVVTGTAGGLVRMLVDQSMVVAEEQGGATRFRLLDTMRLFGQEQLRERESAGNLDEIVRLVSRHRDHYESTAQRVSVLFTDDTPAALALLDDHWDNWRVAVGRAVESGDPDAVSAAARIVTKLWPTMVTFRSEISSWITAVRACLHDDHRSAAWLCSFDAQWAMVLGDPARAIRVATRGIELGYPNSNFLWYIIADSQTMSGNAAAGLAAAIQSLNGSEGHQSEGLFLGSACRCARAHDPSLVRPWAERLCAVAVANGRADDRARAAHAMGLASLVDGDHRTALAWFGEGREAARGLRGLESEALQAIALATAELGDDGAEAAFLEALTALREDRTCTSAGVVLDSLAVHWAAHERAADAAVLLGHLAAHVPPSSVDRAMQQRAIDVMSADPQMAVLMQRGATKSANDVVEFAISGLCRERGPMSIEFEDES